MGLVFNKSYDLNKIRLSIFKFQQKLKRTNINKNAENNDNNVPPFETFKIFNVICIKCSRILSSKTTNV